MDDDNKCPLVVLSSGHSLRLRKVMLFPGEAVAEIAELRAQAAKGLGSSGLGLGVIGTPGIGLALEAGAMLAVSGLLANAVQKTALEYLRRAEDKYAALWRRGVYFEASSLNDMQTPRPSAWSAQHGVRQELVDLGKKSRSEIEEFLRTHKRTKADLVGWTVTIDAPGRYVYNGDEFVRVATDVGEMAIRWAEVVSYYPPQTSFSALAAS